MSRFFRPSFLVVCIALVLGSLLLAPGAEAATKRSISIAAKPSAALAGTKITIKGAVSKTPKGANVKIQRKVGKKWFSIKTVKTKGGGAYAASITLKSKVGYYKYRAVATAFEGLKKATSKSVTVAAQRKTTFYRVGGSGPQFVLQAGSPSKAVGSLNKVYTVGAKATLQRKNGSTWVAVGVASVGANGIYQIPYASPADGSHRVVIGSKGLNAGAISATQSFVFK